MKKISLTQGSKEWLDYRKTRVMASEVPVILGHSPYSTRDKLLHEKITGDTKELSDYTKKIFADGHQWEEVVRQHLHEQGKDFIPVVVECEENEFLAASLDGLSEDGKTILEVKSTSKQEIIDQVKLGRVPPVYYHQIQFQLFCSGLNECLLVVVKDGEMVSITVESQSPLEHQITRSLAEQFLAEMKSKKDRSFLEKPEWRELADLKMAEKLMKEKLEKVQEKIDELSTNILKSFDATHLEGNGIRIQRIEKQGNIDYKSIPELHGVDLDKYRKKSSSYIKCELLKEKKEGTT